MKRGTSGRTKGGGGASPKGRGDGIRVARVEREVQSLISRFLAGAYKGELPGIVTVSMVKMPADLKTARVFVSFFNTSDKEEKEGVQLLQRRAPEIQSFINDELGLRYCPRLTFMRDETTERVLHIDRILRDLDDQKPGASTPAAPADSSDE